MEYVLPQNTSIRDVAAIYSDITKLVAVEGDLTVDTSQVARIDTPVIQLLAILNEELVRRKCKLTWKTPSNAFVYATGLLGLTGLFKNH